MQFSFQTTANLIRSILNVVNIDGEMAFEYYNIFTLDGLEAFLATLKPREEYMGEVAKVLTPLMDSFPNLSSEGDYSFKDICGSYPNDDPRAGWWTISIGNTFINIICSEKMENESTESYLERTENHLDDGDIAQLLMLYEKALTCRDDITISELNQIVDTIKTYDGTQKNILDLFKLDLHLSLAINMSFMEAYHYQPGAIVYSIDPINITTDLHNIAISVRYPNSENVIYTFDKDKVIRTPPENINDELHTKLIS